MSAEAMTVVAALSAVMRDVQSVRKTGENTQQGFKFRGIDAVVNAVGPALRTHGVIVTPEVTTYEYGQIEVGQRRTPMGHVRVIVRYRFHGPGGDWIDATAPGEAMDSGDKATAKAMSVAFRTALLQALALPTDEPDPDATTYQRSDPVPPANPNAELIDTIYRMAEKIGPAEPQRILRDWAESHDGQHIAQATDVGALEILRDDLNARLPEETP